MATPAMPPMPREIQAQAPPPPVYMAAGQADAQGVGGDPLGQLEQLLAALEKTVGDIAQILSAVHPPSQTFLVPMAQAGKALQKRVQELRQQMSGRTVAPTPTPAGPSEVPSARPPV